MGDILKLARIQLLFIVLFAFFKFIRPPVLRSNAFDGVKITLLSLPNFFEGVIGVLTLTAMLLYLNSRFLTKKQQAKESLIYGIALIIAGIYVITQEFKIHNLGGENVYDKNDVIFSIIGLTVGYLIIVIDKPRIN